MPDGTEELRRCLLELPPVRHVVLPYIDILPATETVDRRIVELVVENGSPVVFDSVFDSGDCDNEDQRDRIQAWVYTAEYREDLEA